MNIDDLKDQATERIQFYWGQIQESSAYITIKEKYENLPPNAQKASLGGGAALIVLFFLMIPFGYLTDSWSHVEEFEENKKIVNELLKIRRTLSQSPDLRTGFSAENLRSRMQAIAQGANLQEEQLGEPSQFQAKGGYFPKGFDLKGYSISLKKLNLRQLIDIGYRMQTIHPKAKFTGLDVVADSEDPHYFNVTYKLVAISLPPEPEKKEKPDKKDRKRPSRKKRPKKKDS